VLSKEDTVTKEQSMAGNLWQGQSVLRIHNTPRSTFFPPQSFPQAAGEENQRKKALVSISSSLPQAGQQRQLMGIEGATCHAFPSRYPVPESDKQS
jgi:hypothetical protein